MQEEKRRGVAMLYTTAAAMCCLQLFYGIPTINATESEQQYGARRTHYYQDASCKLETFREFAYDAMSIETDGTSAQVGFGECYARGSTGAITRCHSTNGSTTVETYLDTSCNVHLFSSDYGSNCVDLRVGGDSCPAGGPKSMVTECVSTEPYTIHPETFNLVGSPYKDMYCEEREGGDHIVPGPAFGVGSGDCSESQLVRGPRYALTECLDDNTLYAQVFGSEDTSCSGELRLEMVMFPRAETGDTSGGMCALGRFDDGREVYYRLKACTADDETPQNPDIGPTPAPTAPTESSPGGGGGSNPNPAPVDYRGDGDDEDLRGASDDDDDDDDGVSNGGGHPTDDGSDDHDMSMTDSRESSSSDDENRHRSSDDDDTHHEDSGDCGDSSSKEDDDNGANAAGGDGDGGGGGGGGGGDGLDNNAVFAIAFGVSVAVVTCCLSALLALAGSGSDSSKVGPKT